MPIKNNMKKSIILISILLIATAVFIAPLEARRGCCSHHSGVCGCSCCDGTPLSATCAPYYPECSKSIKSNSQNTSDEFKKQKRRFKSAIFNGITLYGMTKKEVIKAVGNPFKKEKISDDGRIERWTYYISSPTGQVKMYRFFKDGIFVEPY